MINSLFFIPVSAFLLTTILTPFVIRLAQWSNLVDDQSKRFHPAHTHTGIIPRAGGLALYIGIIVMLFLSIGISKQIVGIVSGATILLIVGIIDDKRDINPYIRIFSNVLAAACVVFGGISIPFVTNPFTGTIIHLDTWRISFEFFGTHSILPLANIVALVWIVWTMNIVGWSSGVDGQLPGFVAIASTVLGLLSLRFLSEDPNQLTVIKIALATSGAYLGFLPWNFYPQKIMPGYSGKTLAGFMLATIAIMAQAKVGTAILVLGIPMLDAVFTVGRRFLTHRSPVWADRGHLHHRLLDMGWGRRRIAVFYWLLSIILGGVALAVSAKQKLFVVILVTVWLIGLMMWGKVISSMGEKQREE